MDLALSGRAGTPAGRARDGVPAATAVYEDLRGRIVRMELEPDTTLSRTDLAAEYGVSQTPVREALQRLDQEGLVKIFPQSRTIVSRIDLNQLYQAHFLRVAIECEVVRRLAQSPNPQALSRARSIVSMQEAIVGDLEQIEIFDRLDDAFHQTLIEGAGQADLYDLLKSRGGHLARARRLDLPREEKLKEILAAHKAILAGLAAEDEDAAVAAVRAHLSGTIARMDNLRLNRPMFFAD